MRAAFTVAGPCRSTSPVVAAVTAALIHASSVAGSSVASMRALGLGDAEPARLEHH